MIWYMGYGGLTDSPMAIAQALEWLANADDPTMNLIVVDAAESSGCPSDGAPVNQWLAEVIKPWRDHDHGVTVLDHIPKRSEERPDGPIGSQRKLAAVDGIALLVGGHCWSKQRGGRITLTNHKDRTGNYGRHQPVATILGDWQGEGKDRTFSYRIVEPSKDDAASDDIGGKILNAVNAAGPAGFIGKSKLYQAVGGNRNTAFSTIDNLIEGALLTASKKGQTETYKLTPEGMKYVD